jgi:hypothetical protein
MFYSLTSFSQLKSNQAALTPGGSGFADTQSLLYDGIDDYLDSNTTYSVLDTYGTSSKVTFSVWVKPTSAVGNWIFGNPRGVGITNRWDYLQFGFYIVAGSSSGTTMAFITDTQSQYTRVSNTFVPLNVWSHICIQVDLTASYYDRTQVYMNGGSALPKTSNGTVPFLQTLSSGALRIGENPNTTAYGDWNGNINEFAIFGDLVSPTTLYNGGSAGDLSTIPSILNWWRSENGTWNGSAWDVTDAIGSVSLNSRNMAQASRVNDVP